MLLVCLSQERTWTTISDANKDTLQEDAKYVAFQSISPTSQERELHYDCEEVVILYEGKEIWSSKPKGRSGRVRIPAQTSLIIYKGWYKFWAV